MQKISINAEQARILNSLPLAVAYVPYQAFTEPVSPADALKMGTAWRELYAAGGGK